VLLAVSRTPASVQVSVQSLLSQRRLVYRTMYQRRRSTMRRFYATFSIACIYYHDSASSFQALHPSTQFPALQIESPNQQLPSDAATGKDRNESGSQSDPMSLNDDPKGRRNLLSLSLWRSRPRGARNSKTKDRKRRDRTRIEAVSIASIDDEVSFYNENVVTKFLGMLPFPLFGARSSDASSAASGAMSQLEMIEFVSDFDLDGAAVEVNQQSTSFQRQAITASRIFQNRLDMALTSMVENAVTTKLKQCSIHTSKLRVTVDMVSSQWFRHFLRTRGTQLSSSVIQIAFDRVAFHNLKLSGGGTVNVRDLTLDLPSTLLPRRGGGHNEDKNPAAGQGKDPQQMPGDDAQHIKTAKRNYRRRFPSSFEFRARDVVLTQDDISESSCIRNGLEKLFNRILKRNKITFLNSSKIIVKHVDVLVSNWYAGCALREFAL
jgi:hypothetical protein